MLFILAKFNRKSFKACSECHC